MNVKLISLSEDGDILNFTLGNINVSFANAIRRVILSEIPVCVIQTENEAVNQCFVETNTTRFHNEIVKQRLSCIPIHLKVPMKKNYDDNDVPLLKNYQLEVDVINNTEHTFYVTTEHFRIKNKNNGNYLKEEEIKNIFPPNKISGNYIDFLRLRPAFCESIPGEQIKLKADFSVSVPKVNSMFSTVSICTFFNTPDVAVIQEKWNTIEKKLVEENTENIEFKKRDFMLLDAQRIFLSDTFDFTIQSIGVYDNIEIVKYACFILQQKFSDFIELIETDRVPILNSETTMENCFDIVLINEDYTLGKVLELILYTNYYLRENILAFCGFKKMHPHDEKSIIRVSFNIPIDKNIIKEYLKIVSKKAIEAFAKISNLF